jgi:hypothetical protein
MYGVEDGKELKSSTDTLDIKGVPAQIFFLTILVCWQGLLIVAIISTAPLLVAFIVTLLWVEELITAIPALLIDQVTVLFCPKFNKLKVLLPKHTTSAPLIEALLTKVDQETLLVSWG